MREPKLITVLRHTLLVVFVVISVYPRSTCSRSRCARGTSLRSTDLAIIPADWSFHNYVALFTEQPFLRWLGNSLIRLDRRHAHRRRAGFDRRLRLQPLPLRRSPIAAGVDPHHADVPGHDAAAAALHPGGPAASARHLLRPDDLLHLDRAAVLHLADEGLLRHDSRRRSKMPPASTAAAAAPSSAA